MITQIFEFPRKKLRDVERNLWADARKYVPKGSYRPSCGYTTVSSPSSHIIKDCLDLILTDLKGFRIAYKERFEYNVSDDLDQHIAYCVLPGPVYFQMYGKDPSHFTRQIGILAVGQKIEVTKIQDAIEKVIEKHHFLRISDCCQPLGEDVVRLNETYSKQVVGW